MESLKSPYIMSALVGSLVFLCLSIYNKTTKDPEEVNSNAYMIKASLISAVAVLIVLTLTSKQMRPSENILTNFDQ